MLNVVEFNTKRDLVKINPEKSEILNFKCKEKVEVLFEYQKIESVKSRPIKHLGINRNTRNSVDTENNTDSKSHNLCPIRARPPC